MTKTEHKNIFDTADISDLPEGAAAQFPKKRRGAGGDTLSSKVLNVFLTRVPEGEDRSADEIFVAIVRLGNSHVKRGSIASALGGLIKTGDIKRTAPSRYALTVRN